MKTKILLLISFFFFSIFIYGNIPAEERAALIAFYNTANGDNWHVNNGWKTPPLDADGFALPGTEGTWFGIVAANDHVTKISLVLNNLTGSMTSELGNLTGLEYLDLSFNSLTGSIPPELGNLGSLEKLLLHSIPLTGSIPEELGNLGNLLELSLADNQLSGSIPPELGNLDKLVYLNLGVTQLSGSIPPELGNLKNLTTLRLFDTQLSGSIPAELGKLSKLEYLYLNGSQLSGPIPPELGNLTNLYYLWLSDNQLTGSIPSELGNLINLSGLALSSNRLSGSIPSELENLGKLESLYLNSNQLTGAVPTSLRNLGLLFYLKIGYNGLYTDDNRLRAFLTNLDEDWADTQTIAPTDINAVQSSASSIAVSWTPIAYTGDSGSYRVFYSTTPGGPWASAGMTVDKSTGSYTVNGLSPGIKYYFVVKTRTEAHASNDNTLLSEASEEVCGAIGSTPPFGSFDTPLNNSIVSGSIPVTGWALDDFGVRSVKIYRKEDGSLVYIGDAAFVAGARPDVRQAYPNYPDNYKAGWGYMMLTNYLPNQGNGTFTIHAIATDIEGNQVSLGAKTIFCDNASAVKPFGAIDTPIEGGTASGSQFVNFGWVLTPLPNTIPTDGSTITVWVDGVFLGHPVYNQYRADVAAFFPYYNNSNGAVGYFYLDTTAYEDGVHTIQWTAEDDAGNTDGIGSRYFTIQNTTGRTAQRARRECRPPISDSTIPIDNTTPVRIKKGYNKNIEPQTVYPGEDGTIYNEINQLERLEIHLDKGYEVEFETEVKGKIEKSLSGSHLTLNTRHSTPGNTPDSKYMGYLLCGELLEALPIGSTFDSARGVFYWQPGPAFIGQYRFVFFKKGPGGLLKRTNITVKIIP